MPPPYSEAFLDSVIRMAWADDVSFDKIKRDKGIAEAEVIAIMRSNLKPGSCRLWRKRVSGRASKHEKRSRIRNQPVD